MAKLEDPEADVLDYEGLSALLNRRDHSVHAHYAAMRNAFLRGHGGGLSDRERSLISNMLHVLIGDIGRALNNARPEADENLPNGLLSSLGDGWAAGVYDRLAKAGFLGDLTLIRALAHRTAEHLLVTKSHRTEPAALVAEADAVTGAGPLGDPAIEGDPVVAEAMSDYLVERSRRFDGYGNPRLAMHELAPEVRRRLLWACAAAWREDIAENHIVDEAALDEAVEGAAARALATLDAEAEWDARSEELALALENAGQASSSVLLPLLLKGHVAVFEAMLGRLLNLSYMLVRGWTFEPGGARLAIALCATEATRRDVATLSERIETMRSGPAGDFPRALDVFDACAPEDALRLVGEWRRDPDYVEALRRLRGFPPADDGV